MSIQNFIVADLLLLDMFEMVRCGYCNNRHFFETGNRVNGEAEGKIVKGKRQRPVEWAKRPLG